MVVMVAATAVMGWVMVVKEVVRAEGCPLQLDCCCHLQTRLQTTPAVLLHPVKLHSTAPQGLSRCCCTARHSRENSASIREA
jgi:hypothetical protein